MARPRKAPSETRTRWDALYVTPAERAAIKAAAEVADLSVSRYLVAAHQSAPVHTAAHRRASVTALVAAEARLAEISKAVGTADPSPEALDTAAALLALERRFRAAVLPRSGAARGQGQGDAQ